MLRTWSNPGLLSGSKTKRNGRAILWRTLFSDSNLSCNQFNGFWGVGGWVCEVCFVGVGGLFFGSWFCFFLALFFPLFCLSLGLVGCLLGWVWVGLGVFFGGWCYLSCLVLASLLGWLRDFFFFSGPGWRFLGVWSAFLFGWFVQVGELYCSHLLVIVSSGDSFFGHHGGRSLGCSVW